MVQSERKTWLGIRLFEGCIHDLGVCVEAVCLAVNILASGMRIPAIICLKRILHVAPHRMLQTSRHTA